MVYVLLGLSGMALAALVAVILLLVRAKGQAVDAVGDVVRLTAELERIRASVSVREENMQTRLADKDAACARALAEKDDACRRLLAAADQAKAEAIAAARKSAEEALAAKDAACAKLLADRDALQAKVLREKNEEVARFLQEKERSFAEAVQTLKEQFANLAAQTLKTQSGDLTKTNALQLETVLKPLRDQVELLKSATEKTQTEHAKLAEAIGKDVGRISDVAKELSGVTEALSSNTRFQGRKGEEILAEKLRQAGLEENVNFFLQRGTDADRPDAQVCDTENRWLIIDSKVVLTAYFQYVEATDESARAALLAEHVARVREKIDQLAKKRYPKVFAEEHKDRNYLPVTAMFVGYEAPLLEALKAEPSLWKHAADNNVILVTPLTLLAYLRLVYLAWQHEKEARNQEEIVKTARELLTRMNGFLMTFEELGTSLTGLQKTYDKARGVLVDAPHAQTIAKSANKLIDLHVRLENRRGKRMEKAECLKVPEEEALPPPEEG